MDFETLHSETTYQGRAFSVRRDQVRMPGGRITHLDIIDHVGAVTILPIDASGHILFVRQYRHAAGKELLELPAGTLEPAESPPVCARREVSEETGMGAEKIVKLGEFFLAPGYSTEYMHVYLATDLYPNPLPGDEDEFLRVESFRADQIDNLVASGEIQDAKTLAALFLARHQISHWLQE